MKPAFLTHEVWKKNRLEPSNDSLVERWKIIRNQNCLVILHTTHMCCYCGHGDNLLCRNVKSMCVDEKVVRSELDTCSLDQCTSLETAASELLQSVDITGDAVNTFGSNVADFCDKTHEVCPV